MNTPTYIGRTYRKFESVLDLYAAKIMKTVGHAGKVLGCETAEHLRLPPDAAGMTEIEPGKSWGCEYGNLWLTTTYTVPEEADGEILCAIPAADAVEILCFKNGKPAGIINSKNNFIGGEHPAFFVSFKAKAGEVFELSFECYAGLPGFDPADTPTAADVSNRVLTLPLYADLPLETVDRICHIILS